MLRICDYKVDENILIWAKFKVLHDEFDVKFNA